MDINSITADFNVVISKNTITVKDKETGKTRGLIRGVIRPKDQTMRDAMDNKKYTHAMRAKYGNITPSPLDSMVMFCGKWYYIASQKSLDFWACAPTHEAYVRQNDYISIAWQSGVSVIYAWKVDIGKIN